MDAVQEEGRVGAAAGRVRRDRARCPTASWRRRSAWSRRASRARARGAAHGRSGRSRSRPTWRRCRAAALPARIEPQLATLAAAPPAGDWVDRDQVRRLPADGAHRAAARRGSSRATATTGRRRCPPSPRRSKRSGIDSAWLDGEIVVMSEAGVPDFNALQNAIDSARRRGDRRTSCSTCRSTTAATCAGAARLAPRAAARSSDANGRATGSASARAFDATPAQMLEAARRMELEGIIVKRPRRALRLRQRARPG